MTAGPAIITVTETYPHRSADSHCQQAMEIFPAALQLVPLAPLRSGLAIQVMAGIWIAIATEQDVNDAPPDAT